MSYILDALKKAERERDVSHIPTLATVHDMPDAPSRARYWIILGACLTCAILLVGIFFLLKPVPGSAVSTTGIRSAAEEAGATPIPLRKTEAAPEQVLPRETPEPKHQPGTFSGRDPATEAKRALPLRQFEKEPEPSSSAAKESMRPQAALRVLPPEAPEAISAAATHPAQPIPLREAIAKMNMTVLFYSENRSERIVFINDRKYAEGEYVDEHYLLESIIPEGAWLSYQGDRAILRAKSR